jgi:hypothetical protein
VLYNLPGFAAICIDLQRKYQKRCEKGPSPEPIRGAISAAEVA